METGEPISNILDRIVSANVYLGAFPMAEALDAGADIVITGRVTDTGLVLAPMIHEFGWKREDWDLLAAGTVAGHILECGAQATGGNYSRWWEVPDYTNIGYPIAEAFADGSFIITKHEGTGGVVNRMSVSEQLLYEMGDPHGYITPDCVADFTSIELLEEGKDRVRISGVRGSEATDTYKVSINYRSCFKASGSLTISGPYASSKAEKCAEIVWSRLKEAGYEFEDTNTEYLGVCTDHEQVTPMHAQAREVVLRLGVRDKGRAKVERFRKELAPLITNGPPGVTGFADGRPRVREIIAYFPVLIPKRYIKTSVEAVEI